MRCRSTPLLPPSCLLADLVPRFFRSRSSDEHQSKNNGGDKSNGSEYDLFEESNLSLSTTATSVDVDWKEELLTMDEYVKEQSHGGWIVPTMLASLGTSPRPPFVPLSNPFSTLFPPQGDAVHASLLLRMITDPCIVLQSPPTAPSTSTPPSSSPSPSTSPCPSPPIDLCLVAVRITQDDLSSVLAAHCTTNVRHLSLIDLSSPFPDNSPPIVDLCSAASITRFGSLNSIALDNFLGDVNALAIKPNLESLALPARIAAQILVNGSIFPAVATLFILPSSSPRSVERALLSLERQGAAQLQHQAKFHVQDGEEVEYVNHPRSCCTSVVDPGVCCHTALHQIKANLLLANFHRSSFISHLSFPSLTNLYLLLSTSADTVDRFRNGRDGRLLPSTIHLDRCDWRIREFRYGCDAESSDDGWEEAMEEDVEAEARLGEVVGEDFLSEKRRREVMGEWAGDGCECCGETNEEEQEAFQSVAEELYGATVTMK